MGYKFWERYGSDILWLAAIILCGLKLTQYLPEIIDYPISDEGAYLQDGLDIPTKGVKPVYWGSLYNIWYYVGSLFISDKIALFYAHVKFITIGVPFLFYILLRIIGCSSIVSFIATFFYLISFGNLYIFHKGNHTALFLMLLVLVLGYKLHRNFHFWLLASLAILVSAFIRPELFIAFWFTSAWYVYLLLKSDMQRTKKGLVLLAVCISVFYFSRLMFAHQNRSFYTFQSNFPVNWVKWNNIKLDPDQNNAMLFKQAFGDATTIGGAFKNNPNIFIKNMLWNIKGMGENYLKLGITHFNLILPPTTRKNTFIEGVLVMALVVIFLFLRIRKTFNLRNIIKENSRWLWFSGLLLVPCIIANVLFYPRFNYIVLPIFLSFLLFPLLFFKTSVYTLSKLRLSALAILLFVFMPSPSTGNNWYFAQQEKQNNFDKTPVKNCVEAINALPLKHPVVGFIAEKALYQYTDKLVNSASVFHDGITFDDFLRENKIEIFVVSDLLMANNITNQIVGFHEFIEHPEAHNFKKFQVKNTTTYLLVNADALAE